MDEEMVLCAASSYEQKYYLNPEFESLPEAVKQELQIMCVLYTADVGGVLLLVFDENGKAVYSSVDKKQEEVFRPYLVRVEISDLNIRKKWNGRPVIMRRSVLHVTAMTWPVRSTASIINAGSWGLSRNWRNPVWRW